MGKLPAIQFYPGDWLQDGVSGCSLQAQGLWLNLMMLMHSSERRGYLVLNGRPMPEQFIVNKIGCGLTLEVYRTLYAELSDAGIPRVTSDGIIFNKRMVNDERVRQQTKQRVRDHRDRSVTGDVTQSVTQVKRRCTEDEDETVIPVRLKLEEFDGGSAFEELCQVYKKAERGQLARLAYLQAVEWTVSHKGIGRKEAAAYIHERAVIYCAKAKFQKGLYKWLDEKIFEQDEAVWSDGGIVNGSNQSGGTTPISRQAARNESNREKLAKRILGVDVSRDAAAGGSQREVRIDGQRDRVLEAPGGRIPGGND